MVETWMTTCWPNHVFCFLLAVTVVNVQNAGVYFCGLPKVDALTAWKLIVQQLIENKYLRIIVKEQVPKRPQHGEVHHLLVTIPAGKKFEKVQMVSCKSKYQSWFCSCKSACVRTYCQCTPGVLYCTECYAEHVADAVVHDMTGM